MKRKRSEEHTGGLNVQSMNDETLDFLESQWSRRIAVFGKSANLTKEEEEELEWDRNALNAVTEEKRKREKKAG